MVAPLTSAHRRPLTSCSDGNPRAHTCPSCTKTSQFDDFANRLGSVTTAEGRLALLQELERYVYQEQFYQLQASVGLNLIPVRGYVIEAQSSFILNPPTYASYSHTWIDK